MSPEGVLVVYTLINLRKIKVIAYIHICFNQNLDEKLYITAKNEEVKHLHTVFLLTVEQRLRPSVCRKPWVILTSLTLRDSLLLFKK